MTTDAIDKVARAIAEELWNREGIATNSINYLAIAALRAIREPTEEMVKVMVAVHDEHEDPTDTGRSAAQRLAFQAAIDKALET